MNYKINDTKKKKNIIPEVGQPWMHEERETVFIRIETEAAVRALCHMSSEGKFYSVNLSNGCIEFTGLAANNIILLDDREVVFKPLN